MMCETSISPRSDRSPLTRDARGPAGLFCTRGAPSPSRSPARERGKVAACSGSPKLRMCARSPLR
eukprot:8192238-Alexandrium_andersonii.AAC.1